MPITRIVSGLKFLDRTLRYPPDQLRSCVVSKHNQSMTVYRFRAVLLLFLMLHLTACYTWQGVATTSPAGVIEATQPDHVRVVVRGEGEVELENPSVEGDQLLGANGVSLPLADVLMLEIRKFNFGKKTIGLIGLVFLGGLTLAYIEGT